MIINRVFCYSKDVARKNGNKLPILQIVLTTILGIIALLVLTIATIDSESSLVIILFATFVWMLIIIYYSVILGIKMRNRMIGYATDTNGRIFRAMAINNGQGLYLGGVAAGGLVDQIAGNSSNVGKNLGGAVGAAAQLYTMNRSANYMSNPEIVAKMVEEAPNISGAEVIEILKVYSIIDKRKTVKINCDYKILSANKIRYAKNLTIEKSYNMFEDLINILNTHR